MITVFGPAAARRRWTITGRLALMVDNAVPRQPATFGSRAHIVTSLPPIDTVMRSTAPGWARRNASAASSWVWESYGVAPAPRAAAGQPCELSRESVVAPAQPTL